MEKIRQWLEAEEQDWQERKGKYGDESRECASLEGYGERLDRLLAKSGAPPRARYVFTKIPMLIEVEGGTTNKRARLGSDQNMPGFHHFPLPLLVTNEQAELSRNPRSHSVGRVNKLCARPRKLQPFDEREGRRTIKNDASQMSGKRAGRPVHQHWGIGGIESGPSMATANHLDSPTTPGHDIREEEEAAESLGEEVEDGDIDKVYSATSLKSKKFLKQHSSAQGLPTDKPSAPPAGHPHARARTSANHESIAPRYTAYSSWRDRASTRYHIGKPSIPVSGSWSGLPGTPTPKPGPEGEDEEDMVKPGGGIRPVNKLSGATATNTSRKIPPPAPLNNATQTRSGQSEYFGNNKRQKLDNHGTQQSPIELVDTVSTSQIRTQRGASTSRSTQSQTQDNRSVKPIVVSEFQKVENAVKPSNRPRPRISSFNAQGLKNTVRPSSKSSDRPTTGPQSFKRPGPAAVVLEDDDISSDEDSPLETGVPQSVSQNHSSYAKSTVQVVIHSPPQNSISYAGTANLHPPRAQSNSKSSSSRNQSRSQKSGVRKQQLQDVSALEDDEISMPDNVPKLKTGPRKPRTTPLVYDADQSLDEISKEYFDSDYQTAQNLLDERKEIRKKSTVGTGRGVSETASNHQDKSSSEDESAGEKINIIPSKFVSTSKIKKTKNTTTPGQQFYGLTFACSDTQKWLVPKQKGSWHILHDVRNRTLSCVSDREKIWEISTSSVTRIEYARDSAILVIHKSREDLVMEATAKVYVQLNDVGKANELCSALQSSHSTIIAVPKLHEYLHKVLNNRAKSEVVPRKQQPSIEATSDIALLEARSQTRAAAGKSEKQQPRSRQILEEPNQQRGLARGLKEDALREQTHGELSREFPQREISSHKFYGGTPTPNTPPLEIGSSHATRSSTRASGTTLKPPSSPTERTLRTSTRRERTPRDRTPSPKRWTKENPKWEKMWKKDSIVYPPKGKKQATVDRQDIPRLDEGEFLNDNLIVFYLRYLEDHLNRERPKLAKRIYFQNTYFYEKLTNTKGRNINYEAVERWTAKVNLLEYDYIIVPINENTHWYVAIICNAPKLLPIESKDIQRSQSPTEVPTSSVKRLSLEDNHHEVMSEIEHPHKGRDDKEKSRIALNAKKRNGSEVNESVEAKEPSPALVVSDLVASEPRPSTPKGISRASSQMKKANRKSGQGVRKYNPTEPRIITFDSLGLSHSPTCTNLRHYLIAEIRSKLKREIPDPGPLGMTAKNIPLQTNFCDCGLFLLFYIEMFLENPVDFINDILQHTQNVDIKFEASEMRNKIREILFGLQKEQVQKSQNLSQGRAKRIQVPQVDGNNDGVTMSNSASREASKSTSSSPPPSKTAEAKAQVFSSDSLSTIHATSEGPQKPIKAPKSATEEAAVNRQVLKSSPPSIKTDQVQDISSAKVKGISGSNSRGSLESDMAEVYDADRQKAPEERPGKFRQFGRMIKNVVGFVASQRSTPDEVPDSQPGSPPHDGTSNSQLIHHPEHTEDGDSSFYEVSSSHGIAGNNDQLHPRDSRGKTPNPLKRPFETHSAQLDEDEDQVSTVQLPDSNTHVEIDEDQQNYVNLSVGEDNSSSTLPNKSQHPHSRIDRASKENDDEMLLSNNSSNDLSFEVRLESPPSYPSSAKTSPLTKASNGAHTLSSPYSRGKEDIDRPGANPRKRRASSGLQDASRRPIPKLMRHHLDPMDRAMLGEKHASPLRAGKGKGKSDADDEVQFVRENQVKKQFGAEQEMPRSRTVFSGVKRFEENGSR